MMKAKTLINIKIPVEAIYMPGLNIKNVFKKDSIS
jgi:hypothetical protein